MIKSNVILRDDQKIWEGYFQNLNEQMQIEIQRQTTVCQYKDAERVSMEDFFSGRKIWRIKNGILHVVIHGGEGKTLVLLKITSDNSGFIFPEGSLDSVSHNMEVISVGQTEIYSLSENMTRQMYETSMDARRWQAQQYLKIFSKMLEMINDLSFLSLHDRILKRLYEYCDDHQTNIVKITHEQLAEELATSREVVSRILKKLELEEIIKIERKNILVLDRKKNDGKITRKAV